MTYKYFYFMFVGQGFCYPLGCYTPWCDCMFICNVQCICRVVPYVSTRMYVYTHIRVYTRILACCLHKAYVWLVCAAFSLAPSFEPFDRSALLQTQQFYSEVLRTIRTVYSAYMHVGGTAWQGCNTLHADHTPRWRPKSFCSISKRTLTETLVSVQLVQQRQMAKPSTGAY